MSSFLTVLGCSLLRGLFPSCGERGLLSSCGVKASLVAEPGLWETDSIVVVHGLICALAHGIFPNQEANSCLLHWQADSLPLSHQRSPIFKTREKRIYLEAWRMI